MGYYTKKAKEVKAKQEAEMDELLSIIAEAVEEQYQADLGVIENV